MATSLFLLLDDIAAVLDDVATMTKVAATKTAGVLGDDLAVNAQQVAGVRPDRELPVVWAVARGSLRNKAILVPAALAIASFAPWLIAPLLMLGGAFLCFEGAEKLAQRWLHGDADPDAERQARRSALADPAVDLAAFERDKVRGAVRTDFILSAEIITIALGVVDGEPLGVQAAVLAGVALAMTVGVYGLVGGIVKLDDAGLWLSRRPGAVAQRAGRGLLAAAPRLMQALSVLGTLAMFLVGGGILVHGLSPLHHALAGWLDGLPGTARLLGENLANGLAGLLAGALVLAVVTGLQTLRGASHRRRG